MPRNEAKTRTDFIDPAIYQKGWTDAHIKREETAPVFNVVNGEVRKRSQGRTDYTLRIKINDAAQPLAIALIEAKHEGKLPTDGLQQGKDYTSNCKRFNVPFVFSTNGHQFVMYNKFTGETSRPRTMDKFPSPDDLRQLYEHHIGFTLDEEMAKPLVTPYSGGESARRYYQDAAIRAVLEKIAQCEKKGEPKRALLSLATGAGKTFIAVHLLKKISDARQLRRALFICDRDELRRQGLNAFKNLFGSDAAEVQSDSEGKNAAQNARIQIATYQTLGIEPESDSAKEAAEKADSFLKKHYRENAFSHIIIDECHRSAWGKWSQVLLMNPDAVQIGLTATPRILAGEAGEDVEITADNYKHFGEPVYEYDIGQGIDDGYLALCEIKKGRVNLDEKGMTAEEALAHEARDLRTGKVMEREDLKPFYNAQDLDNRLIVPERVRAMCEDLFEYLAEFGQPEQKTIVFCASDVHCDLVAADLDFIYRQFCQKHQREPKDDFAFKCTAANNGGQRLPDFKGNQQRSFIATTVDLLSTGVDVPCLRNIVFFRYLESPILFYQMIGRGTRLDPDTGKFMFRVYDYTRCTRLFGQDFITRLTSAKEDGETTPTPSITIRPKVGLTDKPVEGIEVTAEGTFMLISDGGKAKAVTIEAYKKRLVQTLLASVKTIDDFKRVWIARENRRNLLETLPGGEQSALYLRNSLQMQDFDLFDVLAELGFRLPPLSRAGRAQAFRSRNTEWLATLPPTTLRVFDVFLGQFEQGGAETLDDPNIFSLPEVQKAGGLTALKAAGNAKTIVAEFKKRLFAA